MSTRILLVEDHEILREILREFLDLSPQMQVAGEAASGEEALERLATDDYDVVVLDWSLPGLSGMETLRAIRARAPELPVVMIGMHPEIPYAPQAFRVGASGYVCKHDALTQLAEAVLAAAADGLYVSPTLSAVLDAQPAPKPEELAPALLSDHEVIVQSLVAAGKRDDEIAHELGLLPWEVVSLRARLRRKLQLGGRSYSRAFLKACRIRMAPPADSGKDYSGGVRIARDRAETVGAALGKSN